MKKIGLALALVLALFTQASAQVSRKAYFFYKFDVDSTTVTYGRYTGLGDDAYAGGGRQVDALIETVGSSVTTSASVAAAAPFLNVGIGDVIMAMQSSGAMARRLVITNADDDTVTVDSAWDLGTVGVHFTFFKFFSGTTASDGWIGVSGLANPFTLGVEYNQGDLGALAVIWECRTIGWDTQPKTVYPDETAGCGTGGTLTSGFCQFATAGQDARLDVNVTGNYDECRVGLKFVTTDASDAGANLEQVTAYVTGTPRR